MGLRVHVGGAVHGQNVHLGHDVVHGGENALLDLAGVLAAADDDEVGLIVDHDGGLGVHAVHNGIALEAGRAQDGVIRLAVSGQLLGGGTDEQLMDEHVLGGQLVHHTEFLGVLLVGAGETVKNEHFAALQVGGHLALDGVKLLAGDGTVDLAPGDLIVNALGVHNEFVVGRTTGVLAGGDHQRAGIAQGALAATQRGLGQLGRGQVAVHGLGADDTELLDAISLHTL